jgi:hypothetical protein
MEEAIGAWHLYETNIYETFPGIEAIRQIIKDWEVLEYDANLNIILKLWTEKRDLGLVKKEINKMKN